MSRHDPYINKLIFGKYLIRKRIGKGSFGTVYQGVNTENNGKIAVKVEKREKNDPGTLENEAKRLVYLQGEGIPKVYCYGNNLLHNLLVEELLGKSLEDIFNAYGKPFSLKTVCVIGIEMIKRIQYVHSKYYIHRDIKPDNFMLGRGENEKKLYIIDFGLAKKYYSISKSQHIKFVTGKHLTGTARYCGRNAHRGYEQGRRDDIESIGYVLMYFLLGVLPWQGLRVKKNEDQFEKIAQKKYSTTFEELTEGQPEEFLLYFKHCDNLHFETQPNYVYLIGLFKSVIDKYCKESFYDYDWNKDIYTYYSREIKDNRKSLDVSLIVNKNNDASAIDVSIENYQETGDEEYDENGGRVKNKKNEKKDVFMGEDNTPIENEDINDDNYFENNKGKVHRSRSMVNIKKKLNANYLKDHHSPKKKRTRVSQVFNKDNDFVNSSNNQEITNENNNNDYKDNIENDNKNENNDEYDNEKSIPSSKRKNDNNYNAYNQEEGYINQDINEYPPHFADEPQYPRNSSKRNNDYYNDDIGNNSNNIQNYNKDENDNGEINQNEDEENETKKHNDDDDDNNLNYSKDIHNLSFEPELGSKKKRRNRSGSVDDKKYRNDNVVCKCNIF